MNKSIGDIQHILTKEIRLRIYNLLQRDPIIKNKNEFGISAPIIDNDLGFQLTLTTPDLLHIAMKCPKHISETEAIVFCLNRDNLEKLLED